MPSSKLGAFLEKEKEKERHMSSGILEILLVSAKNLRDKDFIGKMDPYVLIRFGNQERKSKIARGQGKNPEWNQTLTFRVPYPNDADDQHKISFAIMDKDTFSKDDFVGESTIYAKDVISYGMEDGSAELPQQKYRVVLANKKYYGEMSVGVKFTRKIEDATDDFEGRKRSSWW